MVVTSERSNCAIRNDYKVVTVLRTGRVIVINKPSCVCMCTYSSVFHFTHFVEDKIRCLFVPCASFLFLVGLARKIKDCPSKWEKRSSTALFDKMILTLSKRFSDAGLTETILQTTEGGHFLFQLLFCRYFFLLPNSFQEVGESVKVKKSPRTTFLKRFFSLFARARTFR